MSAKGSVHAELETSEVEKLRSEVKQMIRESQAFVLDAMRSMLVEVKRDNGRSEFGSAEGSDAVEDRRKRDDMFVSRGLSGRSSAPAGRAESETRGSSQGGTVDDSSAPAGRAKSETRGSSQGGAVGTSSVPTWRAESDLSATSTSDTDQGNGEDPPRGRSDGMRSPFPMVVMKRIFMFKSNSLLVNPKIFRVFCSKDQKGTGWTETFFNGWRSKAT